MAETQAGQPYELMEPYNPLDAVVVFDPEMEFSTIVTKYDDVEGEGPYENNFKDYTKDDAIRYPLIKINNKVIEKEKIKEFNLSIKKFLPTVFVSVDDTSRNIQTTDVPGINNEMTVILTAPKDGTNKKISLDFYITKVEFLNNTVKYEGEFKLIELKKKKCMQIGDGQLSTYEFFETVAKECKLGFAATDNCKSISDKRWRQVYSQTYREYIEDQIKFGGLDENSIFDAWIDQYGYLTLVNLPWVMTEKLAPAQLVTKIVGGEQTNDPDGANPDNTVQEVPRTISNTKDPGGTINMMITKYESDINNNRINSNGTLTTFFYLSSPCDANVISTEQVQIIEESIDGIEGSDEYEFENMKFIGTEMSETPILKQKIIVENFNIKNRYKQLYVELNKPNYNLQRGMIINVDIEANDTATKRTIIENVENTEANEQTENVEEGGSETGLENLITNESFEVPNPALSGLYYIDLVGFKWKSDYPDVKQYMYLIKRGILNNLVNKYAPAKLRINE